MRIQEQQDFEHVITPGSQTESSLDKRQQQAVLARNWLIEHANMSDSEDDERNEDPESVRHQVVSEISLRR